MKHCFGWPDFRISISVCIWKETKRPLEFVCWFYHHTYWLILCFLEYWINWLSKIGSYVSPSSTTIPCCKACWTSFVWKRTLQRESSPDVGLLCDPTYDCIQNLQNYIQVQHYACLVAHLLLEKQTQLLSHDLLGVDCIKYHFRPH